MKRKALLRSLMMALLVIVAGCGVYKPASHPAPTSLTPDPIPAQRRQATQAIPASQAIPAPPAPPAPSMQAVARDKLLNEEAARAGGRSMLPPSPVKSAPAMIVAQNSMSKGTVSDAQMISPIMRPPMQPMPGDINTENYTHRDINPIQLVSEQRVSTFGIEVDTGSYTNVRRMLNQGQPPPPMRCALRSSSTTSTTATRRQPIASSPSA